MTAREYPERPIVGVGAIIFDDDRVLLVQRGHAPMKGEWSLPGGALEVGETLEEAVKREIKEETGLTVKPVTLVEIVDRIARDEEGRVQYHYVLVDFLCRIVLGSPACASDAVDIRWTPIDNLGGIAAFTREVILKAWNIASSNQASPFHS